MSDAGYLFKWLMVDTSDEQVTHVYVLLEATGDCPIGTQGWHYKAFPARVSTVEILQKWIADVVLWPLHAPPWEMRRGT
jgi:hypothetical protein